jgi:hypothetical protein
MRLGFAIILIILWLLGIFGAYAVAASVDLLLVVALLLLVAELRRDRRDSAPDHIANPDGAAGVTARPPAIARADGLTVVVQER